MSKPLVQVMAWCRQTTSHYPNLCWPDFRVGSILLLRSNDGLWYVAFQSACRLQGLRNETISQPHPPWTWVPIGRQAWWREAWERPGVPPAVWQRCAGVASRACRSTTGRSADAGTSHERWTEIDRNSWRFNIHKHDILASKQTWRKRHTWLEPWFQLLRNPIARLTGHGELLVYARCRTTR